MKRRFFIIGGGLAGLAAAVKAAETHEVHIFEAATLLGGRCRSFHDDTLGITIDNGNHLILKANEHLFSYLHHINGTARMNYATRARYPFFVKQTASHVTLDFGNGRHPLGMAKTLWTMPHGGWHCYRSLMTLWRASPQTTVAQCCDSSHPSYDFFWNMLSLAILNGEGDVSSAHSLARVMKKLVLTGGEGMCPVMPRKNLADALIDPAITFLNHHGATIHLQTPITKLETHKGHVTALLTKNNQRIATRQTDRVIVAVPEYQLARLLPDVSVPSHYNAIANIHFAFSHDLPPSVMGVVGGYSHWIFVRPSHVSVTISAADDNLLAHMNELITPIWHEVCDALSLSAHESVPPHRCLVEKRATFAQTPMNESLRPPCTTVWHNVFLAGQWIRTGLPATLEGAVRSGHLAFAAAVR